MDNSQIIVGKSYMTFAGPDAVAFYRAATIAGGLRLYGESHILPSRAWKPMTMLDAASKITGKTYKRGEYLKAADDLTEWALTMKAALPVIDERSKP